ncbi:MAG: LysR family transcriptional regulator [Clostridiales bacterium]|nr:LysR family transcriptional regulator [Clostridiales bacterium]
MNIQQLKLFSDVVQYGSVNKAAQVNYISPSTLSRSIQELERSTNTVLFQRSYSGMKLTQQGEEFFVMVQPILHDIQQLEDTYFNEENNDLLRLTVCVQQNSIAMQSIIEFYNTYAAQKQHIDIVIPAYSSFNETIDNMIKKHFMLGVVQYNSMEEDDVLDIFNRKRLEVLCRKSTPVHVVINTNHPLASRETLTLEDLEPYPRLSYLNTSVPDINYHTDTNNYSYMKTARRILIKERAQLTDLVSYTDAYFLGTSACALTADNPRLRFIPLKGMSNEPVTVLLGYQNHTLNLNAQRFLDIFKRATEEM